MSKKEQKHTPSLLRSELSVLEVYKDIMGIY